MPNSVIISVCPQVPKYGYTALSNPFPNPKGQGIPQIKVPLKIFFQELYKMCLKFHFYEVFTVLVLSINTLHSAIT